MCHHEYKEYACGHKEDLGWFCDNAKAYGPLYLKMQCIDYTFGPDQKDVWRQCGKQGEGFYCAETQDGRLIDKFKEHMELEKHRAAVKVSEHQRVTRLIMNWTHDAEARGTPFEDLEILPEFQDAVEQRAKHGRDLNGTRKRITYFDAMLKHAWINRNLLRKGGLHTRLWSYDSFDYSNTVFPYAALGQIVQYLPGPCPGQVAPTVKPIGDGMPEHQDSAPTVNTRTNTDTGLTAQAPQESSQAQRHKLRSIQKRPNDTAQDLPEGLVRGFTPEGEDPMVRAHRYFDMMRAHAQEKVKTSMAALGYDVERDGTRPKARLGRRRPGRRPSQAKPTLEENNSPSKGIKKAKSTPTRVRRSTRPVKNQPNYVDGSENSSVTKNGSPDNSDVAWNGSPDKSDLALAETPSKTNMLSSPTAPARGRKKRVTQEVTGSPNSSPAQDQQMLSGMIRGYQRRLGEAPMLAAPSFDIAQTQSGVATLVQPSQMRSGTSQEAIGPPSNTLISNTVSGEQNSAAKGSPSTEVSIYGFRQSSHTPQQRSAAMQHGSELAQQLGRSLFEQQLASGIIGTFSSTAGSHTMPAQSSGQRYAGPSGPPANLFHQHFQEAMAARASQTGQVAHQHSMSTAAVPASMVPTHADDSNQISPLEFNNTPAAMRTDYENMRRSFSSTSNLTPQHSLAAQPNAANIEPLKRSMPPASQEPARKRVRLSLPGEHEVPVLEPSSSSFRFDAPAALPVNGSDVFSAGLAVIERFITHGDTDSAALPTIPGNLDPRLFEEPPTEWHHDGGLSNGLQLYNETGTIPQLAENTTDLPQSGAQIEQQSNNTHATQVAQTTYDHFVAASNDTNLPQAAEAVSVIGSTPTTGDSSGLSDPPTDLSEPNWSTLLNDDVFM